MKINKVILVAVMVMSGWIASAQSQFDKFEDIEGVTSVVVTQKAFSLMSKIGQDSDEEYMDLIKNINSLKVYATESSEVAKQMESAAKSYLKSANLEELMRVKDEGSNVTIYVKEGKSEDFVKELFMFVKDSDSTSKESVIISLTGDIDLNQIAKLTDKMDLPGGEHLEKASKQ
ncbi:DUF4252 domain-containing protein [Lutimonas saemankumensis]|uniref:DUF4252 domain-containing protein n=1 Tax=Lutimonas saemankumensis TaxID=483016 RepID=UPI001CD3D22F|nr:DUF4252 domain-containing protein [Lutimonas saemankumensis]MCA0931838.1 DUF4252 domain-containing protein [Lutimonas saemankumensis]